MQAGKPSATAEAMAAARAFGTHVFRQEQILDDAIAERFLGPRYRPLLGLVRLGVGPINRGIASLYDRALPGGIGYVVTRHRYFDDAMAEAVGGDVRQVVFVGAGYDSRAFRQAALAHTTIFEIDHPDTQARKKQIVARTFGGLPENVRYLPLDATRGDLRQLPAHGFDRTVPAVFVLEGFLWYMPPPVARDILAASFAVAAPGSQVIFDHILPGVVDGTSTHEGARAHARYCRRRGEPILWGIEPAALAGYLDEIGWRLVDDVGRDELIARYAPGTGLKVYSFLRIARARKPFGV